MYQNFPLLESGNFQDLIHAPMSVECFIHVKDNFEKKNLILPIEKFWSPALATNMIMLRHLIIRFVLHYLCGCLQEVENKGKVKVFCSKSGHGRLQEVPNIVI